MKKKILTLGLALALTVTMLPTISEPAWAAGEKVGISSLDNEVYNSLDISTEDEELVEQAQDSLTPYGRGYASLLTRNELMYINHAGDGTAYDVNNSGSTSFRRNVISALANRISKKNYDFADGDAFRSVAFDPMGSGQADYIATVSGKVLDNGDTEIRLSIDTRRTDPDGKDIEGLNIKLATLPFTASAENIGAWLSISAGNFDGDQYNTQEIAVYRPYAGQNTYGGETIYGATIEVFKIEKDITIKKERSNQPIYSPTSVNESKLVKTTEIFNGLKLSSAARYNLRNKSKYYFYDNSFLMEVRGLATNIKARDWKYQYRFPAVSLETVSQPNNPADDLCVTYSSTLGGGKAKTSAGDKINATRPYDTATGVFFWVDPLTKGQKTTAATQMRFNWRTNYKINDNIDEKADDKWEVMVFGSAGAGDIDADSFQEVVVGGYLLDKEDQVFDGDEEGDWKISNNEYVASFFRYDESKNTYEHSGQSMNWVSMKKSDYKNASAMGEGIYSNYGQKDLTHNPLPVTCFAERGTGYGESVALGGIVCLFDTEEGVSKRVPDDKLKSYNFSAGVFNPRYAIPTEIIHSNSFKHGVVNRLFTETVAGNFDGNKLGQEQLAFAYLVKQRDEEKWSSAYGIIGQKKTGNPDFVGNIDKKEKNYLDSDIRFKYWLGRVKDKRYAPVSVCSADTDNDSIIMRYSGKPNEYFFSDPQIIAVLQAAPYFKDLDYIDSGATSIEFSEGTSSQSEHGLTVGLQVQVGNEFDLPLVAKTKVMVGVSTEFSKTWGDSFSKTYSLGYVAGQKNSVALVMTPYVRYHYEVYDTKSKKWSPIIVDSPQSPRASLLTVEKYDKVAKMQKWDTISDNILKNEEGYPASYDSTKGNKKNFESAKAVGAKTKSDFVKVGSGDSAGAMTQSISAETTTFSSMSWSVKEVLDMETQGTGVVWGVSQSAGYTGASSKADFSGYDYVGEVTNIPEGGDDYSFSWLFGAWEGNVKAQGKKQTFPVLGYLVADVMQPPTYPDNFHVAETSSDYITVAWQSPSGQPALITTNSIYTLYRYQHDVFYPLVSYKNSDSKDGWFSFKDENVEPFSEYMYSVGTVSKKGYQYVTSPFSPILNAYTVMSGSNVPKVVLSNTGSGKIYISQNGSQKITAKITKATGSNVGDVIMQWQRYDPDKGGWINVIGATSESINVAGSEAGYRYRCRVSQRIGSEIVTVFSGMVDTEKVVKQTGKPKVTVDYSTIDIMYTLMQGEMPVAGDVDTDYFSSKSFSFAAGSKVTLVILGNPKIMYDDQQVSLSTTDNYKYYTFTMPSRDVTMKIMNRD